jgi:hypothetical protein
MIKSVEDVGVTQTPNAMYSMAKSSNRSRRSRKAPFDICHKGSQSSCDLNIRIRTFRLQKPFIGLFCWTFHAASMSSMRLRGRAVAGRMDSIAVARGFSLPAWVWWTSNVGGGHDRRYPFPSVLLRRRFRGRRNPEHGPPSDSVSLVVGLALLAVAALMEVRTPQLTPARSAAISHSTTIH